MPGWPIGCGSRIPTSARELLALDEDPGPERRERARTLFARVLDATGGGLRIQTIHAFAQSLLAAFPAEAGLMPGFRPLEGREEQLLARSTLADLLVRAEREGDLALVRDIQALSLRLGEGGAEALPDGLRARARTRWRRWARARVSRRGCGMPSACRWATSRR